MLSKITISNFKSFKKTTEIDFVKKNYTILPQNVADDHVLKGAVFVGANASGKSNVLLAIKLLLDMLFLEKEIEHDMLICLFGENKIYSLTYEFIIEQKNITYSVEVDVSDSHLSEKLMVENELMMERLGESAKSYIDKNSDRNYDHTTVAKNTLFLRTLYFNTRFSSNKELLGLMEFLSNSVFIHQYNNLLMFYGKNNFNIAKHIEENGCDEVNNFFDRYNFGQNINYNKPIDDTDYSGGSDDVLSRISFRRQGLSVSIPLTSESTGNRTLLKILPLFFHATKTNSMLIIDEFSSSFHNDLEELLVKYFMDNTKNSQLFIASHSTNILSNSILRPDQEYAVEFEAGHGSNINRFSNQGPRTAQNIEKMYESGVFGGLPEYTGGDYENK